MQDRQKLVLKVAASALALVAVGLAGWFLLGTDRPPAAEVAEETAKARKERRDDRLEQRAEDLRRMMEAKRRVQKERREREEASNAGTQPSPEERSPARLTSAEKVALRGLMESFYSPERLREALSNRTAPDLAREMSRTYGEAFGAERIGGTAEAVQVGPAVREAISRMGLLKDYGMNALHAQRSEGDEELQWQLVEKINRSFAERIDALNADYPFLGVRLLEP